MKLVVVMRETTRGNETMFAVHRSDCRDLERAERLIHGVNWTQELPENYQRTSEGTFTESGLRFMDRWLTAWLYPGGDVESVRSALTVYPCTVEAPRA